MYHNKSAELNKRVMSDLVIWKVVGKNERRNISRELDKVTKYPLFVTVPSRFPHQGPEMVTPDLG